MEASEPWQLSAYCEEHAPEVGGQIVKQVKGEPKPPDQTADTAAEQRKCAVCRIELTGQQLLLRCWCCGTTVHADCVGEEGQAGRVWWCPGCLTEGEPPAGANCTVCLKPMNGTSKELLLRGIEDTSEEWCHANCVAAVPELSVAEIYCFCRRGENDLLGPMIECSGCRGWFHNDCIDLSATEMEYLASQREASFRCSRCEEAHFRAYGGTSESFEEQEVRNGTSPIVLSPAWSSEEGLVRWLRGQKREWNKGGRWRPVRQVLETCLTADGAVKQATARLRQEAATGTVLHSQGGTSVYRKALLNTEEAAALWRYLTLTLTLIGGSCAMAIRIERSRLAAVILARGERVLAGAKTHMVLWFSAVCLPWCLARGEAMLAFDAITDLSLGGGVGPRAYLQFTHGDMLPRR